MSRRRYQTHEMTPVQQLRAGTYLTVGDPGGPSRPECWEAFSVGPDGERDGMWHYLRAEASGTPWELAHAATGMVLPYETWSRLDDARFDTRSEPVRLLTAIRDHARQIADGDGFLQVSRDQARAALSVLDRVLAGLAAAGAGRDG